MYKNKSFKKILITLGLINLLLLLGYYLLYRDIKIKNENISSISQDIEFISERKDYLLATDKMIKNIDSDIVRIENSIISKEGDVAFIEGLEDIAADRDISISIDSLSDEEEKLGAGNVTNFKIKAKINGGWSGLYTFLAQLESLPFKIKINKFSFSNDSTPSNSENSASTISNWSGTFEINVLKYK